MATHDEHRQLDGDDYVFIDEIGRGGACVVYRVWSNADNDFVAMKRLSNDSLEHPESVRRFKREVGMLMRLQHPGVVPVLDADLDANDPWFTMPEAMGTLADKIPPNGMNERIIRYYFHKILDTVEYLHSMGIAHRDIKPHNVLLIDDEPVVSDFGLGKNLNSRSATLTVTGTSRGTEGYAAPEQWQDFHSADRRADIYALGSLIYQLSTGSPPQVIDGDLRSVPSKFRFLVEKCRRKSPDDRYQSIAALRDDFEAAFRSEDEGTPLADRARRLLPDTLTNELQREKFINLYLKYPNDVALYDDTIPEWPEELVEVVCRESPKVMSTIFDEYDALVSGDLPFRKVDVVARVLRLVYLYALDMDLRRRAITRLLVMAHSHNRFFARTIFAEIVAAERDFSNLMLIRDVLQREPDSAMWSAAEIRQKNPSALISTALREIESQVEDSDLEW